MQRSRAIVELLKLLIARGADPKINTKLGVTPLAVAAGIGWVESVTSEHSPAQTVETVKYLLSLGHRSELPGRHGPRRPAWRRAQGGD